MPSTLPAARRTASPDRRQLIVEAALEVIKKAGVGALTHRRVAEQAGVPLGSTTYYFASLDDILDAAFDLAMERDTQMLQRWVESLPPGVDLPRALTELVVGLAQTDIDTVYANLELVLAAARRPHLHVRAHRWGNSVANVLSGHLSEEAASAAAVVYDGTLLRQVMTGSIGGPGEVLTSFRRACATSGP